MKQTILSILGCMVIAFAITGCVGSRNQFDIGSKSDIQISSNDVSISIKEGTLTNTGATLILIYRHFFLNLRKVKKLNLIGKMNMVN